jgi:HEXXH motif-containing protein
MTGYRGALDLTLPRSGSDAARAAFSGALRARTRALTETSFAGIEGCEGARAVIHRALKEHPAAVFSAMRRTSVHVHFEAAKYGDRARHLRQGYASLLAELAMANALSEPVTLEVARDVVLRSQRSTLRMSGRTVFANGRIDGEVRADTHVPIEGDLCLALVDDNPLAMNEAHPDKEGNALSLGEHSVEEWLASLRGCLDRIATYLPELRAEMALGLQQVVPVGYDAEKHLSASYREALGTIYLTLHPDPMTMTEAVIHEFQHNKLNAALDLDPFLENAFSELVTSPVRPDPRPLHGVMLAVHAFLPVAELYLRMREAGDPLSQNPRFEQRMKKVIAGNHEGMMTTIGAARPTPAGLALIEEMKAIDERHRAAV